MAKVRIVTVGGGYAGVHASKILHKRLGRNPNVEITLIDRNPYHTLMTELHEVAGGRVKPEAVKVSFARIFAGKRVNVVLDSVDTVDFEKQEVVGKNSRYPYDYLILGMGSEPEFFGIKGVQQNALTLWSLEDALRVRDQVEKMFHLAGREADPEKRRELLTFVVGGAGFTGIELAGELLDQRRVLCRRYNVDISDVSVYIVEALDNVCTMLSPPMQAKARRYLEKMGGKLMLSSPIVEAQPDRILIKGGKEIRTRTFVWTAGVGGSSFAGNLDLTKGRCSNRLCRFSRESGTCAQKTCQYRVDNNEGFIPGKRGRLLANAQMQSPDYENAYVVGDNLWFLEKERPLPQIVETAVQTAETAAHNIAASVLGKEERRQFKSNFHGHMVSIGGKHGVAHVVGMDLTGVFAQGIKHMINVLHLFGLGGLNACWDYLRDEFFTIKDRRSFIGGFAALTVPAFMLFPLRIFLGVKWLIEGIKKIQEGWLVAGGGGLFRPDVTNIRLPGVSFAQAGDAVAAATEWAAEGAAEGAAALAAPAADGAAALIAPAADAVAAATQAAAGAASAADTTAALMPAVRPYLWFAEKVLSASPFIAFALQAIVVLAEVAIGLALIGGTFTTIAAGVSIALGVMFIFSGWGNPELLWYIAAALALFFGAGKFLGLDYWIMPALKRFWNRRRIAHKTYLYVGEPDLPRARGWRKAKP